MRILLTLLLGPLWLMAQGPTGPPSVQSVPKGGWTYLAPKGMAVPENNVRAANNFLIAKVAEDDRTRAALAALELRSLTDETRQQAAKALADFEPVTPFVRFFSFYDEPVQVLAERKLDFAFHVNHLHRKQRPVPVRDVPDTEGRVVWIDIRDAGWNIAAAQFVFSHDPTFAAPLILGPTAARMNALLGLNNLSPAKLHCLGIVQASWFVRQTNETVRGTEYYDLLFAPERFPDVVAKTADNSLDVIPVPGKQPVAKQKIRQEVVEKETVWDEVQHLGGVLKGYDKVYPPGRYQVPREVEKKVFKDVEVDVAPPAALLVAKGPYKLRRHVGSAKADGSAVVDFPKNEADFEKAFGVDLVKQLQKASGLDLENGAVVDGYEAGGSAVARQNRLLLRLPIAVGRKSGYYWKTFDTKKTTRAGNFFQTLVFDFKFDAGEVIISTPVGAQAYGLFNNKGERAEFVPEDLAIDRTDKYDHRVRNPGSCMVCHTTGINAPDDLVDKFFKEGGTFDSLNNDKREKVETYFKDWNGKLKADQDSYAEFVKVVTGRTPAANAKSYAGWREYYDDPVTLEKGAVELGITPALLRAIAKKGLEARVVAQALKRPFPVPRTTWDEEVKPSVVLLMDLFRDIPLLPAAPAKKLTEAEIEAAVEQAINGYLERKAKEAKP